MMPHAVNPQRFARLRCLMIAAIAPLLLSASVYEPTVTIALLGDVMLGRGIAFAHATGRWEQALQSLAPILQSANVAIANLESPIDCGTPVSTNSRLLIAPSGSIAALTSASLDIVSLANNHAGDDGDRGARCTRDALKLYGISVLDSTSPLLFSVHGIRLAFLAVDFTDGSSTHAVEDLADQVRDLRRDGNLVIISLHWGMEYQSGSDDLQKRIAQALAESGANILWGHHPHAVQETSWIGDTLVLYSLGNAVFDQWEPATSQEGELVWVEVDRQDIRFYAGIRFTIDPGLGQTGSIEPATFRFSIAPRPSRK
jgi:poly-gamma-glutamate synthesis protein (capsule biosynthesis protein)